VSQRDSIAEVFDVFLCHNSDDKPAVREIAQELTKESIRPWLDEADIRAGIFWHTVIGQQIETVKAAAVFLGQHGLGPWQRREIIALLDQFDKRGCSVIPVILASAPAKAPLPWSLLGLHCVDFRKTDSHPLKRLVWAITGKRPAELSAAPLSEKPATMVEAAEVQLLASNGYQVGTSTAHFGDRKVAKPKLYPPLAKPPNQEQAVQLEILRRRVLEYWVDGVLRHSLYKEVLISLGKQQVDQFVDAPWKYTVEFSDAISPVLVPDRNVADIYDSAGLLLILGEPGSGKSTTLLELAKTLLERAGKDVRERVAVVLNLSSWKKKQPLNEWISIELSQKYRVPRTIARLWLRQHYLIPLLDGLDEVEISIQPDCVAAINAFIDESNPPGLVVCCRLNEYRWLPERLKLNGAIRLELLSEDDVDGYLRSTGAELDMLRQAVKADPVLKELAETPLMLNVMSLSFQGASGDELTKREGSSTEQRKKQIFQLYVEEMFRRKGVASHHFPKEKIAHWLSWLAGRMRQHSQSVFLVEGLQPSWLDTKVKRVIHGAAVALVLGLIVDIIYWFLIGFPDSPDELIIGLPFLLGIGIGCWSKSSLRNGVVSGSIGGLTEGLIRALSCGETEFRYCLIIGCGYAVLAGPFVALCSGLGVGSLNRIALVETMSWKWSQFWRRTIPGFALGLIFWAAFYVLAWSRFMLLSGMDISDLFENIDVLAPERLSGGLITGLVGGLITGLIGGFVDKVKLEKSSPNQGIKLSQKNCVFIWLTIGLIVVGVQWLLQSEAATLWFPYGLIVALIVGLNRGGSAAIKHYVLRLILWVNGYTPFNFVKFLDYSARLILLKKIGGGYIFTHRMLLEYFADLDVQPKKRRKEKTSVVTVKQPAT
jgi:eukaryotic-like serine/threonine-protein kinase